MNGLKDRWKDGWMEGCSVRMIDKNREGMNEHLDRNIDKQDGQTYKRNI